MIYYPIINFRIGYVCGFSQLYLMTSMQTFQTQNDIESFSLFITVCVHLLLLLLLSVVVVVVWFVFNLFLLVIWSRDNRISTTLGSKHQERERKSVKLEKALFFSLPLLDSLSLFHFVLFNYCSCSTLTVFFLHVCIRSLKIYVYTSHYHCRNQLDIS